MKISLNTIRGLNSRYHCADDVAPHGINALAETIGAQLGAIEEVDRIGEKYHGIRVAKVVSCQPHPDSDHMHVCLLDDGGITPDVNRDEQGRVQVVCGAPNVREGLLVAWLPPGSTVPESVGKEPFVLGARELRGVMSNGMLASPRELGLGDSHDGILEIIDVFDRVHAGDDFAEAFGLKDDVVFDIENKMFTHRPDCFGLLGVSRELAGIQGMPFHSPDWYVADAPIPGPEAETLSLKVANELPELVPRFTAVAMCDVQVGPSPTWLVVELAKVGLRSINNIVDYTNFFMLETGQPLHAYDYDKVAALTEGEGAEITVRYPRPGEKISLLNGKEIEPRSEAIMITSGSHLIGVGGVMGGADTEVDETTRRIIVECATFDMYSIRRTAMAHGLFTDAVTRFNKGQSPLQNQAVITKIVDEIRTYAGGKVAGELVDVNQVEGREWVHPPVPVTTDFINTRLGFDLSADDMKRLLENVEFRVDVDGSKLTVTAPFWRTDVETREDVVEEVGRLYGFDKLPLVLPQRSITPVDKDAHLELKSRAREALARAGANEVLTYSFVHGDLLQKVGQNPDEAFRVSNALSPDLQYYRLSLTPSLLDKIHGNIKAGYDEFALFEIGKAHVQGKVDEAGLPIEFERLACVYAARKRSGSPYYQAREYLLRLLQAFGLREHITFVPLDATETDAATTYYEPGRAATVMIGDVVLGRVGEYRAGVRRSMKLPDFCAGFEIGLAPLYEHAGNRTYEPLPRFPKVTQDITLKVSADTVVGTVDRLFAEQVAGRRAEQYFAEAELVDIYQGADTATKNLTYRMIIASHDRTLTDGEVAKMLDDIAATAQQQFAAERV
jgi:phenylalanyl-tRNA synthetase beta chain